MAKQVQINSTKAAGYTFGIEIETALPNATLRSLPVNGYHRNSSRIQVGQAGFPVAGWCLMNDCSISTSAPGYTAVELVSPVLEGREGFEAVLKVAEWMNSINAKTNSTMGTHIHVGYRSVAGNDSNEIAAWTANLINVVAQFERAIQGAAGSFRRTQAHWAQSIRNHSYRRTADAVKAARKNRKGATLANARLDRYHTLNLQNMNGGRLPTVEFRAFSGTTDGLKMVAWISMCLALAERATYRNSKFDAPRTSCYRGNGEAKKTIDRFFYLCGWTLGRKNDKAAEVEADGFVLPIEMMKPVKRELRRLCKKFDSEAPAAR